ncbi:SdrD B-like domain-containing protein [Kutzneria chonburiensis]|uniref:SdrD B-like domain-containing protein n=1 Tax=Kutzneria chonburiensis TaxID=1483604 RepID=A0ABV6MWS6_9PSEU|nr:SdrD B-like domain-containing protein [Kutzneria chonburiensis]
MKRFAVAALAVALPLLSVATAHADTDTVTVKGVAWKDLNSDGIRQPSEPLLPGVKIRLDGGRDVETDATGHYTVSNVYPGELQVSFSSDGQNVLTYPHKGDTATDSDFDWVNGWLELHQQPVDGVLDNIDVGYKASTADPSLVDITPDQPAGTVHVGDEISYRVRTAVLDTPAQYSVLVQFPDGVVPDPRQMAGGIVASPVGSSGVKVEFLRNHEQGYPRQFTVPAKVTRPVDGIVSATITDIAGTDVNPGNNSKSEPLKVAGTSTSTTAQPTTTTTKPSAQPAAVKTTNTAQLANTGADPTWPLIAGLVLLAGGVGTVFFARRRRTN